MVNIEKLLKKKSWTGQELGRLAIANLMLGYQKVLETNNPNEELPINQTDFDKMLRTLTEPTEGKIYNGYMAIHEWVTKIMQVAIAQEQQAQLQYNKLINVVKNATLAENIYQYVNKLPVIMTESQAKKLETQQNNIRAIENGIAIIKPGKFANNIDEATGYYIEPDIKNILANFSLESFFPEHQNYEENVKELEDARELFTASVYFIKAFNICLDLIAGMYDIEEVKIAQAHVNFFEEKVAEFNQLINKLHGHVADENYENDKTAQQKKLRVLENILYPIDLKRTAISKKRLEETREAMKNFKAFREDALNPVNLLCRYIPKAIEK